MSADATTTPGPVIQLGGFRMHVHADDVWVSRHLSEEGIWEPLETEIVKRRVQAGDVALDLGANIGYYTLLLSQLVGNRGHVFSFEPDPTNYALLSENVALNGCQNVTLVNAAVSDAPGRLPLHLSNDDNRGDHRLFGRPDEDRSSVMVEVIQLDQYLADHQRVVDFVKLDIQGAEGHALEGMRALIRHNRDIELLLEFWPEGLRRCGTDPAALLGSLQAEYFVLYHVHRGEPITRTTPREECETCRVETTLFCTRDALTNQELHALEQHRLSLPLDGAGRWVEEVTVITNEIKQVVGSHPYLLVDGGHFGEAFPSGAIPFLERAGAYWGAPEDSATAVTEFERMRDQGAQFAAFACTAFWWLDYYSEFARHVRLRYRLVFESDTAVVFDLR